MWIIVFAALFVAMAFAFGATEKAHRDCVAMTADDSDGGAICRPGCTCRGPR